MKFTKKVLQPLYNKTFDELDGSHGNPHWGPAVKSDEDKRQVACRMLALGLFSQPHAPSWKLIYTTLFGK